jgi:4-amino-4-deoxy-L-arabinose transferase-like glycosyltransferase
MVAFRPAAAGIVLAALLGWFLWLPLADIVRFPDRLSVLPNLETDAAAYDAFAWQLVETQQLSALPTKHPPGWMAMLASVYAVAGHSYVAGKLLSWLALVLTVVTSPLIAYRIYGRSAGVITALLVASSPGLRAYTGTLQYEVVTAGLFTAFLLFTIQVIEATNRRQAITRAVLAGFTAGILVLTRETFVLVVPLASLWLLHQWRRQDRGANRQRVALVAAVTLVGVAATPAIIWSAIQTTREQRLILISDKAREVFEAGNNPRANGTYNEPLVGIGQPAGFAYIRANPDDALRLAGRKLLYSFGILRDGWNVPHPASVWIWRATTGVVPLPVIDPLVRGGWLLLLCLWSLAILGRVGVARWWVLPATCAAILAVHVVTLASYRFAVPLLPIFYVLASVPLACFARWAAPSLRTPMVAAAMAAVLMVAVAAQTQAWPLTVRYEAASLDGLAAANAFDTVAGGTVRVADAARGERPVALLADTYLPRGTARLAVRLRAAITAVEGATPVARITLVPLQGPPACTADVAASQLGNEQFSEIAILCDLPQDGPATLAVFTLGVVDLAIESVRLDWTK